MAEVLYDDPGELRISLAQGPSSSGPWEGGYFVPHIRIETVNRAACMTLDESAAFHAELGRVLAERGRVAA